ncbi:hypothetical protein MFLAVUS_001636 [Mucor flavus]|uniref:mitogen-activated protein kinase kinase n=1 Tax=Mucor flavus TaxID=439312 RepID=A0ABP9YN09_9FUNG
MTDILVLPSTVKNSFILGDKVILQLLSKLDEGTETIMNLRSLLSYKTAELNELVSQLELIDQVLVNVENGTEQIELVLKDVISAGQEKLLDAEATLDSAIKSAGNLYFIDSKKATSFRKQEQLGINASQFLTNDDLNVLQKAYIDLDLAKNIASTIKSDLKQRSTLIKNKNAPLDQIKQIGNGIRSKLLLYKSYTKNSPLVINGKEEVITILDREDQSIQQQNKKSRTSVTNSILLLSRHTTSSKAKSKEPQGPGSTLRLRNITTATVKRTNSTVRKSCSDRTSKSLVPLNTMKRRSLGSNNSIKSPTSQKNPPLIWRSPGHCEIPDILGKAYLEPLTISTTTATTATTHSIKESGPKRPPWVPAGSNWTPLPLPPVIRTDETAFEKRLKRALPKIHLVTMPKSRYLGFKEIGTGVNGAVVQVQVKNTNSQSTKLALKRCKLDSDREYRTAIVRELRIMSSGHFNLIKLREVSIFRNEVWIAMDLMRCSVFAVLCARGLPEDCAIYIARETLNAILFLHTKGFIHRDVKCENLLIGHNGEIKLADFGLATSTRHVNRERLGTAKWMAPEVIKEDSYDEKVDLWSLGITLIEMMDRVPPHYSIKSDDKVYDKILEDPSPTFTYSYPTIYCTGLVAWLLEDDPANRPTAKDVITELDLHLEQGLLKTTTAQELTNFVTKTLKTASS